MKRNCIECGNRECVAANDNEEGNFSCWRPSGCLMIKFTINLIKVEGEENEM